MPVYAPTASVANYQLLAQTFGAGDVIDSILSHIPYAFTRIQRWHTITQRFADKQIETMPQQIIALNEFTIHREEWRVSEIASLESFFDAHFGPALPFQFTAPDDGQTYFVRFKDEALTFEVTNADTRTGDIVLIEVGDVDNSLNNTVVYPSHVEPPLITILNTVTGSSSPQTINVSSSARLAIGMVVTVGFGVPAHEETVTLTGVTTSTITGVFLLNHAINEVITAGAF